VQHLIIEHPFQTLNFWCNSHTFRQIEAWIRTISCKFEHAMSRLCRLWTRDCELWDLRRITSWPYFAVLRLKIAVCMGRVQTNRVGRVFESRARSLWTLQIHARLHCLCPSTVKMGCSGRQSCSFHRANPSIKIFSA
jgi:hypothetical protein